ncbi:MAG TPA: cell wall-binding repeat-containing protein [Solirubrobacterales bacterium]|nr:cell wall-binding repeat-containing protein [Solirubrobacterales bacterium]
MIPKRPINADVPAPEEKPASPEPAPARKEEAPARKEKPPREPKPLAPKLLVGLAALAVVFIVVAIVGSSGGKDGSTSEVTTSAPGGGSPAPAPAEALSFPAFATNNTTRIGGSDPTSNAAGAALAVFPSVTEAQRPAAVTLASEEDWAGAIAASVLMAPPLRAPILFSTPDELPEDSEEALRALDPQGSRASGGAALFAIGSVALPGGAGKVTRVDSGDPATTAAQLATLRDRLFGKPPAHVLVAPSSSPEYAMPAAAWAARSGDPVLYTDAQKLPAATAAALKQHPTVPVFVLGPTTAVSKGVLGEIAKVDRHVRRVGGEDPVTSALALARYRSGSFGWNVNDPGHGFVLARDDSPADAAAAAALSASGTWGPLLLTDNPDTLPEALHSYLLDVKPGYTTDPTRAFYNHVWVVGDQDAISVAQQAEVNQLTELAKIRSKP